MGSPGRPKNAKDTKKRVVKSRPRSAKTNLPVVVNTDEVVQSATDIFVKNLSGEMQKLYKAYATTSVKPIDDLKDLSNTMKARYKIALQTEMEQHELRRKLAKAEYKEIELTGKIDDKKATELKIKKKLKQLTLEIGKNYKVSSTVTTLGESLKGLLTEIQRIEEGKTTGGVNIFNILNGNLRGADVSALESQLFPETLDDDLMDPEDYIEAELNETDEDAQEPV